eukprot:gb/GECG01011048.1/.p1 GENE.gb/GECG01011048.1/~~gb/GECG01011048.1/.p1  ORF type:complete len:1001 (+),score=90.12 gb/GECG01011048.1/:1-3003(+)
MKNGAIDEIHDRYRSYLASYIWRWYVQRSRWLRFRLLRAAIIRRKIAARHLWRRYVSILMERRYQKSVRYVARLQAHIRRRQTQRWFREFLNVRRRSAIKIAATYRMHVCFQTKKVLLCAFIKLQAAIRSFLYRKYLRGMHAHAAKCQSCIRMYLAKKRRHKLEHAREYSSITIQAWWRMCRQYSRYQQFLASRRLAAAIVIQAVWRGYQERTRAERRRYKLIRLQAFVRMYQHYSAFQKRLRAHRKIHKWVVRQHQNWVLKTWVAEVFAATCNGCMSDVSSLLSCESPEYRSLRSIDLVDRASTRDCDDGFKSLMHAAALSGDVELVQYLQSIGLGIDCWDASGSTPLHKAASIGDSHLALMQHFVLHVETASEPVPPSRREEADAYISQYQSMRNAGDIEKACGIYRRSVRRHFSGTASTRNLLSMANSADAVDASEQGVSNLFRRLEFFTQERCEGLLFVNKINSLGETALDVAVNAHRTRGRREHDATIAFLICAGCVSNTLNSTHDALNYVGGTSTEVAIAEANAAREKQLLEKRKRERLNNPHYQYLLVQEQERKKHSETAVPDSAPEENNSPAKDSREPSPRTKYANSALKTALSFTNRNKFSEMLPNIHSSPQQKPTPASEGDIKEIPRAALGSGRRDSGRALTTETAEDTESEEEVETVERVEQSLDTGSRDSHRDVVKEPAAARQQTRTEPVQSGSKASFDERLPLNRGQSSQTDANDKTKGGKKIFSFEEETSETNGSVSTPVRTRTPLDEARLTVPESPEVSNVRSSHQRQRSTSERDLLAAVSPKAADSAGLSKHHTRTASERNLLTHSQRRASGIEGKDSEWSVQESKSTGLVYFYNRRTGKSQWQEPPQFDGTYTRAQLEKLREAGLQWTTNMERQYAKLLTRENGNQRGLARPQNNGDGPPERWTIFTTDDGINYYYDAYSKRTQWEEPDCLKFAEDEEYVEVSEEQITYGKHGWISITDPRGFVYYHNTETDVTQWERPPDFS